MATKMVNLCQQCCHLSIIIFLCLLALTSVRICGTEFRLQTFQSFFTSWHSTSPSDGSEVQSMMHPSLRILVGVLTTADGYERRQLIRLAYSRQHGTYHDAEVDVRFVLCNLWKEEKSIIVALEIMQYDDIIILNCTENMNKGKTYEYFSSVRALFRDHSYDYAMKCDDDTYLRLGNLVESLRNKSREDVYYGMMNPCFRAYVASKKIRIWMELADPASSYDLEYKMNTSFMSGFGYLVSWDLAEWISKSEIARNNTEGPEDIVFGSWLNKAKKGRNRYHILPEIYDYKWENSETYCWRHDFIPETIAVHKLKGNLEWARTLKYFNARKGLKPSRLYHVP